MRKLMLKVLLFAKVYPTTSPMFTTIEDQKEIRRIIKEL